MKAIFIGSVDFSLSLLEIIRANSDVEIVGLVTKEKSTFNSDFVDLSLHHEGQSKPDVFYFKNDNEALTRWVKEKSPDIIFCLGWSHLLPDEVLKIPPKGTIGYHPAALPKNRGRHPIIWALCLGLKKTASTYFLITPTADEGDILSQVEVVISDADYAQDLYNNLKQVATVQLDGLVKGLLNNTIKPIKQEHLESNYWRKRGKQDGRIDWRMSAKSIYNLVRALAPPYPGAFFQVSDLEIPVYRSQIVSGEGFENRIPGEVIECAEGIIDIKSGDDLIRIELGEVMTIVKKGDFL